MRVKRNDNPNVQIGDLTPGATFRCYGADYLLTDMKSCGTILSVDLESGHGQYMCESNFVYPITLVAEEVVING